MEKDGSLIVPKPDSSLTAIPVGSLVPARLIALPPLKPPMAVEEDDYIAGVSTIIERDFYPHLEKLRAQSSYLDAVNNNDKSRAYQLQFELARLTRANTAAESITADDSSKANLNTSLDLDSFQATYTSEDNASFQEIIKQQNNDNRDRYHYLWQGETRRIDNGEEKLLLETSDHISKSVGECDFKARNALMYGPEGVPLTLSDMPVTKAAKKQIVHSATRIANPASSQILLNPTREGSTDLARQIWSSMAAATPALFSSNNQVSSTPKVMGYGFVSSTPSPHPDRDIDPSELMTWGMIEGTPLLIEVDATGGPSFQIPPASKREVLSNNLSNQATKSLKARANGTVSANFKTPLARKNTPLDKLARRFGGGDSQLRQSYSPRVKKLVATPTPNLTRNATPSVVFAAMKTAKKDITDNLM